MNIIQMEMVLFSSYMQLICQINLSFETSAELTNFHRQIQFSKI